MFLYQFGQSSFWSSLLEYQANKSKTNKACPEVFSLAGWRNLKRTFHNLGSLSSSLVTDNPTTSCLRNLYQPESFASRWDFKFSEDQKSMTILPGHRTRPCQRRAALHRSWKQLCSLEYSNNWKCCQIIESRLPRISILFFFCKWEFLMLFYLSILWYSNSMIFLKSL